MEGPGRRAGDARKRKGGRCVENRVPPAWGEGARDGGGVMLRPRVCGPGQGSASEGARLSPRPDRVRGQRDFQGAVSVLAPHPRVIGGGKGRRQPFLFTERSRAGWERRSSLLSLSAFLCRCSESTFAHGLCGRLERGSSRSNTSFSFYLLLPTTVWLQVVA